MPLTPRSPVRGFRASLPSCADESPGRSASATASASASVLLSSQQLNVVAAATASGTSNVAVSGAAEASICHIAAPTPVSFSVRVQTIFMKTPQTITVEGMASEGNGEVSIASMKRSIAKTVYGDHCEAKDILLVRNGNEIEDEGGLLGDSNEKVYCMLRTTCAAPITLHVKDTTVSPPRTFVVATEAGMTIAKLKRELRKKADGTNIPPREQRLLASGRTLVDAGLLGEQVKLKSKSTDKPVSVVLMRQPDWTKDIRVRISLPSGKKLKTFIRADSTVACLKRLLARRPFLLPADLDAYDLYINQTVDTQNPQERKMDNRKKLYSFDGMKDNITLYMTVNIKVNVPLPQQKENCKGGCVPHKQKYASFWMPIEDAKLQEALGKIKIDRNTMTATVNKEAKLSAAGGVQLVGQQLRGRRRTNSGSGEIAMAMSVKEAVEDGSLTNMVVAQRRSNEVPRKPKKRRSRKGGIFGSLKGGFFNRKSTRTRKLKSKDTVKNYSDSPNTKKVMQRVSEHIAKKMASQQKSEEVLTTKKQEKDPIEIKKAPRAKKHKSLRRKSTKDCKKEKQREQRQRCDNLCCRRKLKLVECSTGKCRCGKTFCLKCLDSSLHGCSFDYRSNHRRILAHHNPKVETDKVSRI